MGKTISYHAEDFLEFSITMSVVLARVGTANIVFALALLMETTDE